MIFPTYYKPCFYNHYTALMIDTLSSVHLVLARLMILDRLVSLFPTVIWTVKNKIAFLNLFTQYVWTS